MTLEEIATEWTRAHVRDPNDRNAALLLTRTLEQLAVEVPLETIQRVFTSSVATLDSEVMQ